jgi:predicted MFS family arabinose efflux permease
MAWRIVPVHEAEERDNALDLPGAALVTSGLMLLVYGLVKAPVQGWTAHSTLAYFGISIALLVAFVINEMKVKHPLVPLRIFKIRNVSGANLIQLFTAAGMFSVFFFVSLYIQDVLGYSPSRTGLSFLPMPFVIAAGATIAPRLIKRIGYKPILIVAPIVTAAGLFMLAHVPVNGSYFTHVLPGLLVMAAGLGFTFVSLLVAATSGIAGHLSGLASGLVNTSQQIGGSLGLAIITGVSASSTALFLSHSKIKDLAARNAATVHGFHAAFYLASCFALSASILAFFVIKQKKLPVGKSTPVIAAV